VDSSRQEPRTLRRRFRHRLLERALGQARGIAVCDSSQASVPPGSRYILQRPSSGNMAL
jgi:hypothetical protein